MSALRPDEFRIGRAITREEYEELRRSTRYGLPAELRDLPFDEILLNYQKEAIKTRLLNSVTFIEKSRRTGLTWAFAADAVLVSAANSAAAGMDTFYIGYNLEMAREFIDVCGAWARLFAKAVVETGDYVFRDADPVTGETREIKAFRIAFASGFEIVALPSAPRSLRGKQGYVIIDEAAFHDDLEEMLKAAMALLIWGGMVVVISTHNGVANAFNRKIEEIRAGLKNYGLLRIDFDEALAAGLYQRVCQRSGKEWSVEAEAAWRQAIIDDYGDGADEELFCIPSEGSGAWLLPATVEQCMTRDCPVLRFEMPASFAAAPEAERNLTARVWFDTHVKPLLANLDPNLASYFGHDFGRVADLSVTHPVQRTNGMHLRTPFIIEMRNIPFAQQEQVVIWMGQGLPRFSGAALDARGNGAALAEKAAQALGFNIVQQVQFTVEWYRQNMPKFKATLEARGMDLPYDAAIRDDYSLIKMIDGVARVPKVRTTAKGELAADGKKKTRHGDAAIAGALAHFAANSVAVAYGFEGASTAAEENWLGMSQQGGRQLW
jgi:phage FluMu gp28-like protein